MQIHNDTQVTPNPRDPTQRGGMGGGRGTIVSFKINTIQLAFKNNIMQFTFEEDTAGAPGCREVVAMAGDGVVTRCIIDQIFWLPNCVLEFVSKSHCCRAMAEVMGAMVVVAMAEDMMGAMGEVVMAAVMVTVATGVAITGMKFIIVDCLLKIM